MDYRESWHKLGIALGLLIITLLVFILLQHWTVYNYTLGCLSKNYEHLANGDIVQHKIPYTSLSESNFLHWDAAHYQNIRDHSYTVNDTFGEACYAFFPMFPWIWKMSHLSARGISLLNYLLFVISLMILSNLFLTKDISRNQRLLIYALAILLPGSVSFNIPYTESIFLFTFSMACYGLKKNILWLFALSLILFAFSRPAVTIILAAIVGTDIYFALTGRTYQTTLPRIALRIIPILFGTFAALYVQYRFSGHWFKVFEVQRNWGYQAFHFPAKFTDWSAEGYGLSVFTLVGIFVPALIYILSSLFKNFNVKNPMQPVENQKIQEEYLFTLSLFYLLGITLFTLFFRGGSLNGLQRYALATPFFYIVFFSMARNFASITKRLKIGTLLAILVTGTIFFVVNSYSSGFSFAHNGFYLFVCCFGFLMFMNNFSRRTKIILSFVLFTCLIVWKTYLLNMFLSDGWIFT